MIIFHRYFLHNFQFIFHIIYVGHTKDYVYLNHFIHLLKVKTHCFKSFLCYLLCADDTIILVENERDLQTVLDSVHEYCTRCKLIVCLITHLQKL